MNRIKCPVCGNERSEESGENKPCFHCTECGFAACEHTDNYKELAKIIKKRLYEFYSDKKEKIK